jgi:transcriptional regulator of acetoin/glycerol metabolism
VLMVPGDAIRAADLGLLRSDGAARGLDDLTLEEVEGVLIRKALARHAGNVSLAAKALGLSRSALYRRLERHGL